MYSRYHDQPVRIPENYGGVAFSEAPPAKESPRRLDVAKPTPPPTSNTAEPPLMPAPPRTLHLPPLPEPPPRAAEPPHAAKGEEPPHPPTSTFFSLLHGSHTLFGKMKFDDLLLLALLLLLSQNDSNADLLPWLALLLFCG